MLQTLSVMDQLYIKIKAIASKHHRMSSAVKQIASELSLPSETARVLLGISMADADDMKLEDDTSGPRQRPVAGKSCMNSLSPQNARNIATK